MGIESLLTDSLISFIHDYTYVGVFVLMLLESALIPIPSEVTMPFAGFLAAQLSISLWGAIVIGALGNLVGSLIAYYLGYAHGDRWSRQLIKKVPFLAIDIKEYEKAKKWIQTRGNSVAFFSRLLPVVRTFVSLPAGVAKAPLVGFSVFTFVGSLLWSGALAYGGYILGENWDALHPYFRKFEIGGIVLVAGFCVYIAYKKWKH